jgi:hypothetical protein
MEGNEMNVYLKNIVISIFVLFISSLPMCCLAFAGSSTQLGSTYLLLQEEIDLDRGVAQSVELYSAVGGYDTFYWYGSGTTCNNIYLAANGVGASRSIAFYIGHGDSEYLWNSIFWEQQWFIGEDNGGKVYDKDIFSHSSNYNVRFAFLWSCEQGDTIGGSHWSGTPFGMPNAWLHTASLSSDGYANPDSGDRVFLGFYKGAPEFAYDGYLKYRDFLVGFYYAALCGGTNRTVKQALDYAARCEDPAHYMTFADTDLYNGIWQWVIPEIGGTAVWTMISQMKVYGNSDIYLSDSKPTCAMKTKTDGNFYFPSGPPPLYVGVQIQLLFNDDGIVGDQKGGVSPYPLYTGPYPDGSVNMLDSLLINGCWGLHEGQSGWEYMADIVPDRVINILDAIKISTNFGKSGTYTTDFTDVTVIYYWGGQIFEKPVDSKGFVTIPSGTSFTVARAHTPIGAMVIFWSRV